MLQECRWRGRGDLLAAEPGRKAHALARHIATGLCKNFQHLGIAAKLHPGFGKYPVGIGLDQGQPLF